MKQAQQSGYRSRAAYKLLELDERDQLFRPGMTVVDLGAAPGGWSQVARHKIGPRGRVVAVDLLDMDPISGVEFIQGDFSSDNTLEELRDLLDGHGINLVMSDLAPNITGRRDIDQARTLCLNELVVEFSEECLEQGGAMVIKAFHGEGFDALLRQIRQRFVKVAVRKPKASRSHSSEVYIVARRAVQPA